LTNLQPEATSPVRYVLYGAGAIGGTIGARLAQTGHEVVFIARGRHLDAIRSEGLRLVTPDEDVRVRVRAVGSPAELDFGAEDVVILAVKSQDTSAAVAELTARDRGATRVVCAQNGVDNERVSLRRGHPTYGMCVIVPATHLEPGVVLLHTSGVSGVLDVGRYPEGTDGTAERLAADLRGSSFVSDPQPRIMRWKYTKLLNNLGNALDAACGMGARDSELYQRARAEAKACYEAAGIDYVSQDEDAERRRPMGSIQPAGGVAHPGSSSWQSLARSTGSIEADWLNGEIVLLGQLHGVPTPVNEVLRRLANRMAAEGLEPESWSLDQVGAMVEEFEATATR
jgi:2-dehydropantoate 2-reductase